VTTDVTDVAILGAGPAGIGAALRLSRRGHRVTVLEREHHVGGLSSSLEIAGIRVDHGSHRLHRTVAPDVLAEIEHLLGGDLQRRRRDGRIRLAGRWLPFPLQPTDLVSLPPAFAARAALDTAAGPWKRPREDTFAEVIRAGLGRTMLDRFYGPYARKLWGLAPEQIDGEQARRRVGAASPGALVRRVVRGRDPEARTFLYPRRGFGQIAEALAEAAVAAGADLRLATTVTQVVPGPATTTVRTDAGEVRARQVWSTLPLPVLARLWADTPADVVASAGRLESRAMTLVYLVLDTDRYTRFDAHYLPESWTPVTRISEPKNYRSSDEDPTDRTVLCFEVPCRVGDEVWTSDGPALRALAVAALEGAGLPRPRVTEVVVRRLPAAYPIYGRGFAPHRDRVEAWATSLPRTLTFGRQGLFVHDNSHHALAMAWAAGDCLDGDGRFDEERWTRARRSFEGHVVED
jgi:protoporphyrinogen oxidase